MASEQAQRDYASSFLTDARKAFDRGQKRRADFFIARYLGSCENKPEATCVDADLQDFLKYRKLSPKAFIPSDWDPGFLAWFEKSIRGRWDPDPARIREKQRSFEIAGATFEDKYFVTVVAYPEIELWHEVENGIISKPVLMAMGSSKEKPTVFFGKIVKGFSSFQFTPLSLNTLRRTLHYVYKPEFDDLDGDGMPEVWLRYNLSWGNGFAQILEVYRIKDERELILVKRFEGLDNGYARRMGKYKVEVAVGASSQGIRSGLNQDTYRVETWAYEDGQFKMSPEASKPLLLKTPDWVSIFSEKV